MDQVSELNAIIAAVRDRVRTRYPQPGDGEREGVRIPVADLMPLVHARDAAQARIAAIGSVNPRAGGVANSVIQNVKKLVARALQWFVRDQVIFNREMVSALEAAMEALNEHNCALTSLAAQTNEHMDSRVAMLRAQIDGARAEFEELRSETGELRAETGDLRSETGDLRSETRDLRAETGDLRAETGDLRSETGDLRSETGDLRAETGDLRAETRDLRAETGDLRAQARLLADEARDLKDMRLHWNEWRLDWERKVSTNEIQFLRTAADLQGAFQHRSTMMETNFRDIVKAQHADYLGALDRANEDIQKRLWADLRKVRAEYDRLIHDELRIIRQRAPQTPVVAIPAAVPLPSGMAKASGVDYTRFAYRFRGSEDEIRRSLETYRPYFADCSDVLDIGCDRGEFLEMMREGGVAARGIDLSQESVEQCRGKGLDAEVADLFPYLGALPDGEFDGIFSSQVVEHLEPPLLPEMIRLCASKLRRGGVLAIETPNPECLAIFATYFYLDPTHTRPVPHPLVAFYMEEAGMGGVVVHKLAPAAEQWPELNELPEAFRQRFFGGLDYAIVARKL